MSKTKTFTNPCTRVARVVEERSGRRNPAGPLHDFPLQPGQSVTIHRRDGVRLRWRLDN